MRDQSIYKVRREREAFLARVVDGLAFWPAEWHLAVKVGEPEAHVSHKRPSDGASVLTLGLPVDWEESVLAKNLAIVRGARTTLRLDPAFTLAAWPPPRLPEGADGCWWLLVCWPAGDRVERAYTWMVRFAGRDYFSPMSADRAMAKAAQDLEEGLGLREELPF